MKSQEKKLEFIRLRAEGKSYRQIAEETGISKSTCSEWERELSNEIARLRQENMEELYSAYGMAKEARIARIGQTLQRIEAALEAVDLSSLPPEKLLDFQIKYTAALRQEYTATAYTEASGEAEDTLTVIQDLYRRTASGETTTEQAKTELNIIDHIIHGYQRTRPFDDFKFM